MEGPAAPSFDDGHPLSLFAAPESLRMFAMPIVLLASTVGSMLPVTGGMVTCPSASSAAFSESVEADAASEQATVAAVSTARKVDDVIALTIRCLLINNLAAVARYPLHLLAIQVARISPVEPGPQLLLLVRGMARATRWLASTAVFVGFFCCARWSGAQVEIGHKTLGTVGLDAGSQQRRKEAQAEMGDQGEVGGVARGEKAEVAE
jgi:hypothetical protein